MRRASARNRRSGILKAWSAIGSYQTYGRLVAPSHIYNVCSSKLDAVLLGVVSCPRPERYKEKRMPYLLPTTMFIIISISCYVLFTSERFKGKVFLYLFFLLSVLGELFWFIPDVLLHHDIIDSFKHEEFFIAWNPTGGIIYLTAWAIMLVFVINLRSLINGIGSNVSASSSDNIENQNHLVNESHNLAQDSRNPSYLPGVGFLVAAVLAMIIGEIMSQLAVEAAQGSKTFFGAGVRLQTAANIEGVSTAVVGVLGLIGIILLINTAIKRSRKKSNLD